MNKNFEYLQNKMLFILYVLYMESLQNNIYNFYKLYNFFFEKIYIIYLNFDYLHTNLFLKMKF